MKATTFRAFADGTGAAVSAGTSYVNNKPFDEAVAALVAQHNVILTSTGRPVFVDREGRRVSLYLRLDPAQTDKGQKAYAEQRRAAQAAAASQEFQEAELRGLLQEMSTTEAIAALKGKKS